MPEKIIKTIPWFLILALIGMTIGIGLNFRYPEVKADTEYATTTVTVGNVAPTLTFVYEDSASTTTSPTNEGSNVTFKGKANDLNNEAWWLIICQAEGYATTGDGSCPSCTGGTWVTSSATTTNNATATVNYTTTGAESCDGNDESCAWHAYACDANIGEQLCSGVSQGTGGTQDAYSPFNINHRPSFDTITDGASADPGGSINVTTTASDADTEGGSDTVDLYICDGQDTSPTTPGCEGVSQLCATTSKVSNPSCSFSIDIPTADDTYHYYGYVFDNHIFAATGTPHDTQKDYIVNNIDPTVSLVKLNNEEDINLIEGSVTTTQVTGLIYDANGYGDVSTGTAKAYRTASSTECISQDDNFCYYNLSCTLAQYNDTTASATCTVSFWYHADPTGTTTPWAEDTWSAALEGKDDDNATSSTTTGATIEVIPMIALDITTGEITYGGVAAGQKRNVNVTSTVAATGNCALDTNLSGTDMTGPSTITVGNQKYSTTTGNWDTTGTQLSTSTLEFDLELPKTTATSSTSTKNIYWGINVPSETATGDYSGQNTFEAVLDEIPWP